MICSEGGRGTSLRAREVESEVAQKLLPKVLIAKGGLFPALQNPRKRRSRVSGGKLGNVSVAWDLLDLLPNQFLLDDRHVLFQKFDPRPGKRA